MRSLKTILLRCVALFPCVAPLPATALLSTQLQAADLLTVGSDAPALNVEHWVQNGNGRFKPVTKFENGKVYVVEFWATWCGPCVQSMPHLASLQKEYADKGVQIVSISDEDLETVEKFLEREVRGGTSGEPAADGDAAPAKKTYRDLTSAYCLTTDPDQSSYEDYMNAAAQNGIPTAFIVGKDAKIEWIGHPMEMDGPISSVVAGTWDREAFAAEIRARQEAEKAMQEIFALLQKQEFESALKLLDETIAKSKDNQQLKMMKLQVLIVSEKTEAAAEHLKSLFNELIDEPEASNMIAWNIYEMAAQGRLPQGKLIETSIAATKLAVTKAKQEEKASLLDTLAHLVFVSGDLEQALSIETEALKLTGDRDREFIENFIKELQEAKKNAEAPETDPAKK